MRWLERPLIITYIAKAKKQELAERLENANFFSLLTDGTTDSSNTENEISIVVTCDTKSSGDMVHTKTDYVCLDHHPPQLLACWNV